MNVYKSMLLSAISLITLFPVSLSALTFKELETKIRTARACLAPIELVYTAY